MAANVGGGWVASIVAGLLLLALAHPAAAQLLTVGNTTFANSTTMETTLTNVTEPGVTVVAPASGPLNNQLANLLAGPNGALIARALSQAGVLGPVTLVPQGIVTIGTNTTVSTTTVIGPGTLIYGPGESLTFLVGAGDIGIDTNTDTHLFEDALFQNSQSLTTVGLNWLLGDLHTEFQTAILDGDFNFVDGLLDHAGGPGSDPLLFSLGSAAPVQFAQLGLSDTPPPGSGPWSTWFKGDYFSTSLAGTAANFGFDEQSHGGSGGVDYRNGDLFVGGAFSYEHGDVTQKITLDRGTVGSWRFGAYGGWRPDPWSFTAVVAGGFHDIAANRLTLFPMPSTSSYGARTFDVAAEAARKFPLGMATLQSVAGLVYSHLDVDRFSETGGLFNIAGQPVSTDALNGYLGARLYQAFDLANGMRLLPEARARVMYDLINDPRAFTASFVNDPTLTQFPVTGINPPRLAGLFGTSLSLGFLPNWRAFLAYDAEVRGGETAHLVSGGVKVSW